MAVRAAAGAADEEAAAFQIACSQSLPSPSVASESNALRDSPSLSLGSSPRRPSSPAGLVTLVRLVLGQALAFGKAVLALALTLALALALALASSALALVREYAIQWIRTGWSFCLALAH